MTDPGPPPPPPPTGPSPGWYPSNGGTQWWDGAAWGEWQPTAAPPPAPNTVAAVIAHAGGIVGGFLAPLVVYLAVDKADTFTRTEAAEALNFQLTLMIAWVVGVFAAIILAVATLGIALIVIVPAFLAVQIGATILMILGAVSAGKGKPYRYPVNLRFVKA